MDPLDAEQKSESTNVDPNFVLGGRRSGIGSIAIAVHHDRLLRGKGGLVEDCGCEWQKLFIQLIIMYLTYVRLYHLHPIATILNIMITYKIS